MIGVRAKGNSYVTYSWFYDGIDVGITFPVGFFKVGFGFAK